MYLYKKRNKLTSEFVFSIKVNGLTLLGTLIIGGGGTEVFRPNIMYGGGPFELIKLGLSPVWNSSNLKLYL